MTAIHLFSDLRIAARSLRKSPGFNAVCILILAVAIGANTAVFSVVEAVLLRPLPYTKPGELYCIDSSANSQFGLFSLPEYCDYREANRGFTDIAAVGSFNTNLVAGEEAQIVQGLRLTANLFHVLGARPAVGRLLAPADDEPAAPRVAVLGYGLWQRSFGGRADVVGSTISLSGESYTIVGVLPAGFVLPVNHYQCDVCVPLRPASDPLRYVRSSLHYLVVFGRLAPGVGPAQAQAGLDATLRDLESRFPKDYSGTGRNRIAPIAERIVGASRSQLLTLLGVVGALLLLACANLAGLQLVRTLSRHRELAIRVALGCSRFGLARLLLAESLVLAAAGGMAGLLFANGALHALLSLVPADLPRAHGVQFNGTVFAFAAAVSLVAALAPALVPAAIFIRGDIGNASLAAGGRSVAGGRGQTRLRHFLVSAQVGVSLALLAGAALFMRSFWAAGAERLGFDADEVVSAKLSLPEAGYRDRESLIRLNERIQANLAAIPGVTAVGGTSLLPLAGGLATAEFDIMGRPRKTGSERPSADYRLITPGYLGAMGVPLRQGRFFRDNDDLAHPLAVIINATLAEEYFPRDDAVGRRLSVDDTAGGSRKLTVVGVVGDVKEQTLEGAPGPELYVPYRQMDPVAVPWIRYRSFWVLRAAAAPRSVASLVRERIQDVDRSIPVAAVRTLRQVADGSQAARRFTLIIIGFFAAAAVLLTASGIYAVVAYGVSQRTREMGVRLALGATGRELLLLVLREGVLIVAVGGALGIGAALGLSRLVAAQLYRVSPYDPSSLGASILMISAAAFVACWLPARRASRVDPMVALHSD